MKIRELFESEPQNCIVRGKATLVGHCPARIEGDFVCSNNDITTLEGAPDYVGGDFTCFNNKKLTTLEGGPTHVGGGFNCPTNNLATLKGAPKFVGGGFNCVSNRLTNLEGAPDRVTTDFFCYRNELTTLKGGPSYVGGLFSCSENNLTSLEGAPEFVGGDFVCKNCPELTSLKGVHKHIKQVNGVFDAFEIKSHVLGLLLIKGITEIDLHNRKVNTILNRHLGKGMEGVFDAQEELIEAGLEEYAQL